MFAVVMMTAGVLYAQTTDSITQAKLDSIDAKMKMLKLKAISISAPKPVYSMTGEMVNYNVENDETVRDLTAWDAIRNAPTVPVKPEASSCIITMVSMVENRSISPFRKAASWVVVSA